MNQEHSGTGRQNAAGTGAATHGIVPERSYWKPDLPSRQCAECGKTYKPNKHAQQFCGKSCSTLSRARAKAAATHTERACPTCGKKWAAAPSNPSQFCSRACLRADWQERRRRVCVVCAAEFHVEKAGRKGLTCSDACLALRMSQVSSERRATPETRERMSAAAKAWHADPAASAEWHKANAEANRKWHADPANAAAFAKRSSERMKKRHADPEWQAVRDERSSRVMTANWEKYRDEFTQQSVDRYTQMQEAGEGLCSEEAKARKAVANKWIMEQAKAALGAETPYNEVYAEVQARLRQEQPFNPGEDYYDYCKWLGTAVVTSPECRAIHDAFMSEAIPRFAKAWNDRKAKTTVLHPHPSLR